MIRPLLIAIFCFFSVAFSFAQEDTLTGFYYPDGMLSSQGHLRDGEPDGFWKTFHQNGKLKSEGNRVDFQLNGTWKFYFENGKMSLESNYNKGLKNGVQKKFHESGTLRIKEFYTLDVRDSIREFYSEDGVLIKTVPFVEGKESGPSRIYDPIDGRMIGIITYRNGFIAGRESFNRKDKFNQRQGIWKEFYTSNVISVEGKYKNDLKHGYFKEYDEQGNLEATLKYENDVLIPDPEELVKLDIKRTYHPNAQEKSVGSYSKGLAEGVHRFYDMEGNITSAKIFRKGDVVADGILDGEGRRQGYWKEYYETGELKREGKYKNGLREGPWKFYYSDGKSEQLGTYRKGKPEGDWKWYFPNGEPWRTEVFYEGLEEGLAIEYNDTGKVVSRGEYSDGEKEGEWLLDYGDHREEGKYRAGQRDEEWKYFAPNGQLVYKGKFVDGREDGKHTRWFTDGAISEEGKYSFGQKDGTWLYYNEMGTVIQTITYKQDKIINVDGVPIKGEKNEDKRKG